MPMSPATSSHKGLDDGLAPARVFSPPYRPSLRLMPDPTPRSDRVPDVSGGVPLDLYQQLRGAAHQLMRGEATEHTLQTTALVHEAYLRLIRSDESLAESPARLLAAAGIAMRNALVDHARSRLRVKRGGDRERDLIELSDVPSFLAADPEQIVALEDALDALAIEDELAARVVHLRFHLGLGVEETAQALDISPRTVKRRWAFARTWLFRELNGGGETASVA